MKIAHLTSVHHRRDTRVFIKECRSLTERYQVSLIVADGFGDETVDEVSVVDVGRPASRRDRMTGTTRKIARKVRELDIGLVHFHDPELIPVGMWLKSRGVRVIYDVHEDVPRDIMIKEWIPAPARYPISFGTASIEGAAGTLFDGIVAATPRIAARFPRHKTAVVRNFPRLEEFQGVVGPEYSERPPQFAYIGTLSDARGVIEAVRAIGSVPGAQLKLAGKFNTADLEHRARNEPGWSSVDYLGMVDRATIASVLAASRAGLCNLLPTQTHLESLPIKMFEYMAAGLPIIASDFPYWRELLAGVDCAIFVDPTKPDELAAALRKILSDPAKAKAMGEAGRQTVLSRMNWEAESAALLGLYQRILS